MAAFVTDQFRILNASNFIDSVSDTNNSYYAFLGLPNPTSPSVGFGRTTDWDTNTPNPVDNLQYLSHYRDTSLFGKKITESNVVRVVRKIDWTLNNAYDMYRHDYSVDNQAPVSKAYRLYDANYYVITSAFRVYICISNGSSGNIDGVTTGPQKSTVEPSQTTPGRFETSDGYEWLYLFSITPADIIKFDSTEYIPVPNNWDTNIENQPVYEAGDNGQQIKKVYIENGGVGFTTGTASILGDGSGGIVQIDTTNGSISNVTISDGGSGYTYGIVDLSSFTGTGAKLIPIIPPSTGHGRDIYQELGTDKILLYARFDDSDRDFPVTTQFSQIGIIKNPQEYSSTSIYSANTFSSLSSAVLTTSITVNPGDGISQDQGSGVVAKGYIASFDPDTKVLKYYQDRSLVFGNKFDQTANANTNNLAPFISTQNISFDLGGSASIDTSVDGTSIITTGDGKLIDAGVTFTQGLSDPEINKKTGEILYIDNRPVVERDCSQKEDIKIILDF